MNRRGLKGILTTGVLATSLLASTSAMASSDILLNLEGVPGDSTTVKGAIDVQSWSWGESNGSVETRRGTAPKVCIQDLHFVKEVDSSSPALIMKSMLGEVIPRAELIVRRQGGAGDPVDYVRLILRDVIVSSFQTGGSAGSSILPMEQISLHFNSGEFQYLRQNANGSTTPIVAEILGGNSSGCR